MKGSDFAQTIEFAGVPEVEPLLCLGVPGMRRARTFRDLNVVFGIVCPRLLGRQGAVPAITEPLWPIAPGVTSGPKGQNGGGHEGAG